jgi:hypothetical protein
VAEHRDDGEQLHPLLAAGWKQGVLFDAPRASYELNVLSASEDPSLELGRIRAVRARERLVLISHACDIKASDERYIEALICKNHNPNEEILSRWDQNSPRYFVVDPEAAYVADASHRVKIEKDALITLRHDGLAMDELRLYRFVEWLTRRYDRPTVPDALYERFHAPVSAALRTLPVDRPGAHRTFNIATNEIRVTLPTETLPPYRIGVVYLTLQGLSEEQLEAIHEVHQIIAEAASNEVIVEMEPVIIELDEVPFGVLRRTQPLIIEYPCWDNDEAAPPGWLREQQED